MTATPFGSGLFAHAVAGRSRVDPQCDGRRVAFFNGNSHLFLSLGYGWWQFSLKSISAPGSVIISAKSALGLVRSHSITGYCTRPSIKLVAVTNVPLIINISFGQYYVLAGGLSSLYPILAWQHMPD